VPKPILLKGDHITLAQAVKQAGLAETGGQAKHLVRGGTLRVNGIAEARPARKLRAGDRLDDNAGHEWVVHRG
jgi:ribosome-associated protein